ncbi:MAG: LytR C-terminal domain-containing protein, partial [Ilumatobacteraceae bacterium]
MEKSGPVLVGIALIGALSGVLVSWHDDSPGVVRAAPDVTQLAVSTTTSIVASAAPVPTSAPATTADASTTSTVIVASEAVAAPTTPPPTTTEAPVVDTVDIPAAEGPDPTLDLPPAPPSTAAVESTTVPATVEEPPPESPDPPWAAGGERATVRVVIANADLRPDLDEATLQRLAALGYTQVLAAADLAPSNFTTIYYRENFNRAAVTLAIDLEADEVSLEPMPATPLTNL